MGEGIIRKFAVALGVKPSAKSKPAAVKGALKIGVRWRFGLK